MLSIHYKHCKNSEQKWRLKYDFVFVLPGYQFVQNTWMVCENKIFVIFNRTIWNSSKRTSILLICLIVLKLFLLQLVLEIKWIIALLFSPFCWCYNNNNKIRIIRIIAIIVNLSLYVLLCYPGGSLDMYGRIPEPVLGRILVSVS